MSRGGHEAKEAPARIRVWIVTASDGIGEAEDVGGAFLRDAAAAAGHEVLARQIVRDDQADLRAALDDAARAGADVIVVNGGTGIGARNRTYDAVASVLEQRLDGFGELFRMLTYGEIGSAAILSRAVGGVWNGRAVFCVPGSRAAVRRAWEALIAPQVCRVVREIRKGAS